MSDSWPGKAVRSFGHSDALCFPIAENAIFPAHALTDWKHPGWAEPVPVHANIEEDRLRGGLLRSP